MLLKDRYNVQTRIALNHACSIMHVYIRRQCFYSSVHAYYVSFRIVVYGGHCKQITAYKLINYTHIYLCIHIDPKYKTEKRNSSLIHC